MQEERNTKILVLAGVSTILNNAIPVGHNLAIINSPADIIKNFCNETIQQRWGTRLDKSQMNILWASIVSIFLVGGWIGSLIGAAVADRFGRKKALLLASILSFLAAVIFSLTELLNSIETLILGRLVVGLGAGISQNIMPIYLTELAPSSWRGSIGVLIPFGVSTGIVEAQFISLEYILGNEQYWVVALVVYVIPLIIGFVLLLFLPESPQFLQLVEKRAETNDEKTEKSWSVLKVVLNKDFRLAVVIVASLNIVHQFCGFHAVLFYSTTIFHNVGLSLSVSQFATIGVGAICVITTVVGIYNMAKFSRRHVCNISLLGTGVFLIILGLSIQFTSSYSWVPYVSIAGIMGMVTFFGIGLAPIPYFIASEIFETGPRSAAMALGNLLYWLTSFIVGQGFPIIEPYLGGTCFYIFAAFVFAELVFTWFYMPETRGRSTTELANLCKMGFRTEIRDRPTVKL